MPTNQGTLVIAAIRPNNTQDSYPTAYSNEIKGGHHTYPTFFSLLNIPTSRKQAGMLATITDDTDSNFNNTYVLKPDLITWEYLESKFLMTGQIDSVTTTYNVYLFLSAPYIYKISKLFLKSTLGTASITILNNNIAITGFEDIGVSESVQEITSADPTNYINIEDELIIQISSPSINLGAIIFQLELTRILPIIPIPTLSVCGLQGAYLNSFTV